MSGEADAHKAEFREGIRAAIPSLTELLKSENVGVPSSVVSLLGNLANYSELKPLSF